MTPWKISKPRPGVLHHRVSTKSQDALVGLTGAGLWSLSADGTE